MINIEYIIIELLLCEIYQIFLLQQAIYSIDLEQKKTKEELEESYGKINVDLKDGSYEVIKED